MKISLFISLFFISSLSIAFTPKVIYGNDDRKDVYETTDALYLELAQSTAAMINASDLVATEEGSEIKIRSVSLQQAMGVCSSEPFAKQPVAANCSAFLVAEDILVTAGHCVQDLDECQSHKFVFDFKMESPVITSISVPKNSVYSCKEVLGQKLTSPSGDDYIDYAVIRLDRKVTDRRPLEFRRQGQVDNGAPLVMIGHPSGLPTKIADGAIVRDNQFKEHMIVSNVDAFGGNSGSAVFHAETGEVEGILVYGAQDYVMSGFCRISNRVADDYSTGEWITKITSVTELQVL